MRMERKRTAVNGLQPSMESSSGLLWLGRGSQDAPFCPAYAVPSPRQRDRFDILGRATHPVAASLHN